MPAFTSTKFADSSKEEEDLTNKMHSFHFDADFSSSNNAQAKNEAFRGKALPTGDRNTPNAKKGKKSSSVKNDNAKSKYTVKELTLNIEKATVEDEDHEMDDIFPDDISDRVHLFDRIPHPPLRSALKKLPSRTQSAKASFITTPRTKQTEDVSKAVVLKRRPASAHVINSKTSDTSKPLEPHLWKYDCKESPRKAASTSDLSETAPEPLIIGCKSGRIMSGKLERVPDHTEPEVPEEQVQESGVPKSLRPFLPWQVHGDIPQHWIGVDPSTCLVLCPSLLHQVQDLPTVPPKQLPEEELDYIEKICPPAPTKKYQHPWNKLMLPEHKCSHIPSVRLPDSARVRIYNMEGQLLHETYQGNRTQDVVRKEIQELEDLMKGIGNHDGSLFVQYQAEITSMQNMLDQMNGRIEEIERREEERRRRAETPDYFGLKKFYKEHEAVMSRIRQQHELCVAELAAMEGCEEMDSQHFSRQHEKHNRKT